MNRSLYVIKPEAMPFRDAIHALVFGAGLNIVRSIDFVIPTAILDELYVGLCPDLREAIHLRMGCAACEIGEVVGENAVRRLLTLRGLDVDPGKCDPQSIRRRFGLHKGEQFGCAIYFSNALHAPTCVAEAERDLRIFAELLDRVSPSPSAPSSSWGTGTD